MDRPGALHQLSRTTRKMPVLQNNDTNYIFFIRDGIGMHYARTCRIAPTYRISRALRAHFDLCTLVYPLF